MLERIGVPDRKRIFLIMTDPEKIWLHPLPDNPVVRVFNVARLTWKKPVGETPLGGYSSELDFKGSDVMVRGLGMFRRETGIPPISVSSGKATMWGRQSASSRRRGSPPR